MNEFGLSLCCLGSSFPNLLKLNTFTSRSLIRLRNIQNKTFVCICDQIILTSRITYFIFQEPSASSHCLLQEINLLRCHHATHVWKYDQVMKYGHVPVYQSKSIHPRKLGDVVKRSGKIKLSNF